MPDLLQQPLTWTNAAIFFAWVVVLLLVILGFVTYAIYFERKILGWMQLRIGPNRTGPLGLLQTVADVFKLLIKEDTIPRKADRELFILAPIITFIPAFVVTAVIPYSSTLISSDLNVGVLYYVALSGISTIGIVLGGWASNNKYALLGGMRSAAQMISYEIPLVISVVGVIMMTGSMNLNRIVEGQAGGFWHWNFLPQIVGFAVFVVAAVSELNRTPFDLPEAESELVAGYHVEYSGFRFAFFHAGGVCICVCDFRTDDDALSGRMACAVHVPRFYSGNRLVLAEVFTHRIRTHLDPGHAAAGSGGSTDGSRMAGAAAAGAAEHFCDGNLHGDCDVTKPAAVLIDERVNVK